MGRAKRILKKIVYPYGKQTGGMALLKKDLKAAPRDIARAIVVPGSDLFETNSERRLRDFRDLLGRGYKPENAMRITAIRSCVLLTTRHRRSPDRTVSPSSWRRKTWVTLQGT